MKKLLLALLVIVTVGGGAIAVAHGGMPFKAMMRDLDLSEQQRSQIKSLLQQQRESKREKKAEHQQAREDFKAQLSELLSADVLDEEALSGLMAEKTSKMTQYHLQRARVLFDIKALLTPEQQQQLNERLASGAFAQKHSEKWGHRGWQ